MNITLHNVTFNEQENQIEVSVIYSELRGDDLYSAEVRVVLDEWTDSYAEAKQQAFVKAHAFLQQAASAH